MLIILICGVDSQPRGVHSDSNSNGQFRFTKAMEYAAESHVTILPKIPSFSEEGLTFHSTNIPRCCHRVQLDGKW